MTDKDWHQEYLNASADAMKFAAENGRLRAENEQLKRNLRDREGEINFLKSED